MSNSDNSPLRKRSPVPLCDCGMAAAAEVIGDRWTLLILREAFYGVMRFDDMLSDLGISRSVLTDRLSKLVRSGILTRFAYREDNDRERFAYGLTEEGRELGIVLLALMQWGNDRVHGGAKYGLNERPGGLPVRVALLNNQGREVEPDAIEVSRL